MATPSPRTAAVSCVVHLSEGWMRGYIKYARASQAAAIVIFPVVLVGAKGGTAFTCNPYVLVPFLCVGVP